MKVNLLITILFSCTLLYSCGDDDKTQGCTDPTAINYNPDAEETDGSCIYEMVLTQAKLDSATTLHKDNMTGNFITINGDTVSIAHNGDDFLSSDSTIREAFIPSSVDLANIKPGDIIVKHSYLKNPDGSKGALSKIFYMYKQPQGYFNTGGDWEYGVLEPTNVNSTNKNGLLTDKVAEMSGKTLMCGTCHVKGGTDFVFTTTD